MGAEGTGSGFLETLTFFPVIILALISACPHRYHNTLLRNVAHAVSPTGAPAFLYQRGGPCHGAAAVGLMCHGAPCGVAPGWKVCFLSLFFSMDAIHKHINLKSSSYVERAARTSGHGGSLPHIQIWPVIPEFLSFPRTALCFLKAYL